MSNKNDTSTPRSYKLVNFCEFDKFAEQSYCAIHGVDKSLNLGDITLVDETKISPFNMICGGSPCQDFSVAGGQAGSKWKCKDCDYEYNPLTVHYTSLSGSYWARGNSNSGFMALMDVAYGKPYDVYSFNSKYYNFNYEALQRSCPGANCLHAHEGSMLRNDEIIVYKEEQCTIKYLVELKN